MLLPWQSNYMEKEAVDLRLDWLGKVNFFHDISFAYCDGK